MHIYIHGFPKRGRYYYTAAGAVKYHKEKVFVVIIAYAVGDPWTMMVHPSNAGVTESTVMGSVWFSLHAPLTGSRLAIFILFIGDYQSSIFVFSNISGLVDDIPSLFIRNIAW